MSPAPSPPAPRAEYAARINRVLDHIQAHLAEELPLVELAQVAAFSPYHFHRVFRAWCGETVGQFVARLRVERAATQLVTAPRKTITEIALDCGYSSSATFARAFREAFGLTPTEWRAQGGRKPGQSESNPSQTVGNRGKDSCEVTWQSERLTHDRWRIAMTTPKLEATVTVQDLPERTVAYIRHLGPYAGDAALFERLFARLMAWAGPRNLLGPDTQCLTLYYDDPGVTDPSKLRLDCCVVVPADTAVAGEIGKATIPAGRYAVARFELLPSQYAEAWEALMAAWLPESGYQPADGPCFERYLGDPKQHPEGKQLVELGLPVKPL